tara:strand:+ start:205 stop:891 length:687 start_codon:yes stop_codon:yes gene_type:complete
MKTDFKEKGFTVLREVLPEKVANFVYKYFLLKRKVADIMYKNKYIPPESGEWGSWTDPQVINTYSIYGDIAMETILEEIRPLMERVCERRLYETYSYARIYKRGDVLARHKDRFSCEISTTMNLGGDPWPIYINPNPQAGYVYGPHTGVHKIQKYMPTNDEGVRVDLNPGDMLIYRGMDLEHWRDEFQGENCGQVFLHYNDVVTDSSKQNKYDGRACLGLPHGFDFKI